MTGNFRYKVFLCYQFTYFSSSITSPDAGRESDCDAGLGTCTVSRKGSSGAGPLDLKLVPLPSEKKGSFLLTLVSRM